MRTSEGTATLTKALIEAQKEFPAIAFDMKNDFVGYEYASLKAVIPGTKAILTKHGLVIIQAPTSVGGAVGVTTRLAHESGEWIEEDVFVPLTEKKGMTPAQVAGSIITYLRRYAWGSILGLVTDKDTDGQLEVTTEEIDKLNKKVAKILERVWSIDAMEEVVKADIGVTTHEGAKEILDLSVLPEDAPIKLVASWVKHFVNAAAPDNVGCAQAANEAYTTAIKAKKTGGK